MNKKESGLNWNKNYPKNFGILQAKYKKSNGFIKKNKYGVYIIFFYSVTGFSGVSGVNMVNRPVSTNHSPIKNAR
jgi:hypothetical protein